MLSHNENIASETWIPQPAALRCGASYIRADQISLKSWNHEDEKVGNLSRIKRLKRLKFWFYKTTLNIFWGQLEEFGYGVRLDFRWFWRMLEFSGVTMALWFFKKYFIFRERKGGRKRQRETLVCLYVVSHMSPTGDLAHNSGICPDWESNQWPSGSQNSTQLTEPHQLGPKRQMAMSL